MTSTRPPHGCRSTWALAMSAAALIWVLTGVTAGAQDSASAVSPLEPPLADLEVDNFELTPALLEDLGRARSAWDRWQSALLSGQTERLESAGGQLIQSLRELGLERFGDVARSVSAEAQAAARRGDVALARRALDVAEALDPGRPETLFRRARVERRAGQPVAAARAWLGGAARWATFGGDRSAHVDLGVWLLLASLAAGGLWVGVRTAVRGPGLWADLEGALRRRLPVPLARLAALVILVWPLVLPLGIAWWLLYLSVLLWPRSSVSERITVVVLWLLVGLAPWALAGQRQEREMSLSPAVRALDSLDRGNLYGGLFRDFDDLLREVADDPAAVHLAADLHRKLGQWDQARFLYQQLLLHEPANAAALVDLGAYYFLRGAHGDAVRQFEEAVEADPTSVEGWYGLSLAHSASYDFPEAGAAMDRAQALDDGRVSAFLADAATRDQPRQVDGGIERVPALRERLRGRFAPDEAVASPWLSLLLAPVLAGLGFAVGLLQPGEPSAPTLALTLKEGRAGRWQRAMLPGVSSAETERGPWGYLALWPVAALWTVPVAFGTLRPSSGGLTVGASAVALSALALLLLVARLVLESRKG